MDNKDGGPAFPVVGMDQRGNQTFMSVFNGGMTLRDYFAAKALAGEIVLSLEALKLGGTPGPRENIARGAYLMADAMLAVRGEK